MTTTPPAPPAPDLDVIDLRDGVAPPSADPVGTTSAPDEVDASASGPRVAVAALAGVVLTMAAVALTLPAWNSIYADGGHRLPILGSTLVTAVFVAVAERRRIPSLATFVASIVVAALALAARSPGDAADVPGALVDGWKALASTGLLAPTTPLLLVAPVVTASVSAWLMAEALVRRKSGAVAVVGLALVHTVTVAYTVSQRWPSAVLVAALLGVAGLMLAVAGLTRPGGADFAEGERRLAAGPSLMALAVVAALTIVGSGLTVIVDRLMDRDDALDLRDELVRPVDVDAAATPLSRVKAGLVTPEDRPVFTIRLAGLGPDEEILRLPVVALDRYDGAVWESSARFEVAGAVLPAPGQRQPTGSEVVAAVSLRPDYPFRYLPRVGSVHEIQEGELAWDPVSGTLLATGPTATDYRATSQVLVEPERPTSLGTVTTALGPASARAELTEDQVAALERYLAEVVDPEAETVDQLTAIEADLRSDRFGYNAEAPGGHSLAAIVSYLDPTSGESIEGAPAARIGFAEHAAASFAVLARELGVPSRVVVGYLLEEPITAEAPEAEVTLARIHAWPEIWIEGTGWIGFEPTNRANEVVDEPVRTPAVSATGLEANAADLPDVEQPTLLADEAGADGGIAWWWWLVGLALLPVLYAAVVVGAKAARRRRRRSGDPNERAAGAWAETRDRLGELGLPSSRALSALDIADELDTIDLRPVADEVVEMAPVIDEALYSPHPVAPSRAERAWQSADQAVELARRSVGRRRRVTATLDPRPLLPERTG